MSRKAMTSLYEILDPRTESSEAPDRLIYRVVGGWPCKMVGLGLVCLGLALLLGFVQIHLDERLLGIIVTKLIGVFLLLAGLRGTTDSRLVLDRSSSSVVRSWGVLFPFWKTSDDLSAFTAVAVESRVPPGGDSRSFPVSLSGPKGSIELFRPAILARAEELASEVGKFLELPTIPWQPDPSVLATAEATMRKWRRSPERVESGSTSRLAYETRFQTSLRFWGALALALGLPFLVGPAIGIEVRGEIGQPTPAWLGPLLGGFFALVGLVFLFGKKGKTIDRSTGTLTSWWGILFLVRAVRHEIGRFRTVTIRREIRNEFGAVFPAYRIALTAPDGGDLRLFDVWSKEEACARAGELGGFLGLDWRLETGDKAR